MNRSLLLIPLLLAACATPKAVQVVPTEASLSSNENIIASTQDFGGVQLSVDNKGSWLQLVTIGSAAIASEDPKHVDDAFRRARAAAYQQIAKFMAVQVSTKTKTTSHNDDDVVVRRGLDEISEHASALLKGVMFDNQRMEGDRVTVRAFVTPGSITGANQFRDAMQPQRR